jgi:hypothetical protein
MKADEQPPFVRFQFFRPVSRRIPSPNNGALADRCATEARELQHWALIEETATIAALDPPAAFMDLNECDFERLARAMHKELLEPSSPEALNRTLALHRFRPIAS